MVLRSLFATVFTKDYVLKVSGRESCRMLIRELEKLEPSTDFGNEKTGFLNLENVIRYGKEHGIFEESR